MAARRAGRTVVGAGPGLIVGAALTQVAAALSLAAVLAAQPVLPAAWPATRVETAWRATEAPALVAPPPSTARRLRQPRLAVGPASAALRQSAPDRWFGRDKWLHAAVAASLQFTAYALLRDRGASRKSSHFGAALFTGAASVGKEWHDARSGGVFSRRDLVWDAAGALAGSTVAHQVDG